ncbi:MAG: RdgB/HAM1 family non-canonical purine NTP pyrophosphatase [Aureispira sp.]
MQQLVFATGNAHKVKEIQQIMGEAYQFLSLKDIGCTEEIPETTGTIKGNAIQKAQYVYDKYGYNCFAEDTGLLVDALDGAPGVDTAFYGGLPRNPDANINRLLTELEEKNSRKAHFKTIIAIILDGKVQTFEGKVHGAILTERQGIDGFGYDPIFQPEGYDRSFAQMDSDEKGAISHRGRATVQLQEFLRQL